MASRTIAFVLGALLCHQLRTLPDPLYAGLFPLLLPVLLAPRALAVPAAFAIGIAWSAAHGHAGLISRLPAELQGSDLRIQGEVVGVPQVQTRRLRFRVRVTAVQHAATWRWRGCRIDLSWYSPPPGTLLPQPGEVWRASVRLSQPRGLRNPGGYHSEHRALRESVCARGYLRAEPVAQRVSAAGFGIDALRARIAARIDERLAGLPARGVVKALAVGLRGDVTAAQSRLLQITGTAHLMAISGLHVGLVAGLGLLVGRGLARVLPGVLGLAPAAHWGALTALLAAGVYAALAGFSVPTQRALIMLGVLLAASLARRRWHRGSALCAALAAVLTAQPLAVFDAGTWLSFAAVAGLMWAIWREPPALRGRLHALLGQSWRVQIAACLVLLPLALLCFGYQSLVAPLANLIAVPVTGVLVVPTILAGIVVDAVGVDRTAIVLRAGAHVMGVLLEALQRLPGHDRVLVSAAPPGSLALAAGFVGIGIALLPVPWRLRAVGLIWLAPLLLPMARAPAPGALSLRILDVGQGLSVIVRTHAHVLVFDAGPAWSGGFDAGARIVAPALLRDGIARVDRLIVSHRHDDHAGGVHGLLRSIRVDDVLGDPGPAGPPATPCRDGQSWTWDGYAFDILHPPDASANGNDASCVLRIAGPGGRVLLPADVEAGAESRLLRAYGPALAAEVLLVPHHGSRTSSGDALLAAVRPHVAVNSSGHRNRFRQPAGAVVTRYRRHGVVLYDTACSGQVWIRMAPGAPPRVSTWSEQGLRFWHSRDAGAQCSGP
jgi:competence protein ComEC